MSTAPPPSSGPDPARLRIGDAERTSALDALGEHMASGRIDLDEYGQRSAQVTQARTVADLRQLFEDLPPPHPDLPGALPAVRPTARVAESAHAGPPAAVDPRSPGQRAMAALVAVSGIIALVLFFVTKTWLVFLIPAVIAIISGAIWNGGSSRR